MRYPSRQAYLDDADAEYAALLALLGTIPRERWREPGVWGEGWTVHDLVAHLAAWHRLFLAWYDEGLRGGTPAIPAPGFKFSELPRLNRVMRDREATRPTAEVWAELEAGHARTLEIAGALSDEELLRPGRFRWTGRNGLITYVGANTSSHYRFAQKVLKRWLKGAIRGVPARA